MDTLFGQPELTKLAHSSPAKIKIRCFPNPFRDKLFIEVESNHRTYVNFVFLDENFAFVRESPGIIVQGKSTIGYNLDLDTISNRYYRVYYKFWDSLGTVYYQGYGDVFKE